MIPLNFYFSKQEFHPLLVAFVSIIGYFVFKEIYFLHVTQAAITWFVSGVIIDLSIFVFKNLKQLVYKK